MKILVTGGAGFIGSHLVKSLVQDGFKVHALVKESTNLERLEEVKDKIQLEQVSLLDTDKLTAMVGRLNPQGVFHLAASNIQSGVTAPDDEVVTTNILGTRNLVQACDNIDYRFFIISGSFLEYGPKNTPAKETNTCAPTELYSITKLAVTLYGQAIAKSKNKPIVSFRLFTPYGPKLQAGRLVQAVLSKAIKNEEISLSGPDVTRDFIYVKDLVDLFKEAMNKAKELKGEVFNAGSGNATTLKDFSAVALKIINSKSKINWGTFSTQFYDYQLWQADMQKTFSKFSWRPRYSLEDGLKETAKSILSS